MILKKIVAQSSLVLGAEDIGFSLAGEGEGWAGEGEGEREGERDWLCLSAPGRAS